MGYNRLENLYFRLSRIPLLRHIIRRLGTLYLYLNFSKAIEARLVFKLLDIRDGDKILDLACGYGQYSMKMKKLGCEVCSIDSSNEAITFAKDLSAEYDINLVVGNAENLPLKSEYFGKVAGICVLEHFKNDEKALLEMNRVLKFGGLLVLTVDSFTYKGISRDILQKHKTDSHVVNYYSVSSLAEKLFKAGFKLEKSKYFVNSGISSFFINTQIISKSRLLTALFPLSYGLSIISDYLFGRDDGGYFLAVKARKVQAIEEIR